MGLMASRDELLQYAARDVAGGARSADVVEMLVKNGMDPAEAQAVVQQMTGYIRGERTRGGLGSIVLGALMAGAGVVISVITMSGDGGGVLFYGLIVVGVITMGRGLFQLLG